MFAPGTVIAQKYWVERVLGEGGMGIVVAATHLQLGQRVALKFLRPAPPPDAETVERFLREARAAVRLRSEHVCRVVDVGTADSGVPYIVMEHLEGHDLATVLKQGGALPVARAVDYVLQACLALAEAHVAGMVHRDLKPANLFLTRRPEGTPLIKVMDFGIAKAHGRMDARLTDSAAIMGSPSYMSPEQLKSARDVDARADIWSLGVVLFELVTRRRPFDADNVAEIAAKVTLDPPAALPLSLPRGFPELVLRCLEKNPARRFANVGDLARALAPFGSPGAVTLASATSTVIAAAAGATPRTDPLAKIMGAETRPRWKSLFAREAAARRRTWMALIGASVLVAALAIALVVVIRGRSGDQRTDSSSPSAPAAGPADAARPVDAAPAVDSPVADAATPVDAPPPADAAVPVDARSRRGTSRDPIRDAGTGAGTASGADDGDIDLDGDGIPDIRGR